MSSFKSKFTNLGQPSRIWVMSAIYGDLERLIKLHGALFERVRPGDKVVYTGNYLAGPNAQPVETIDEILYFRRTLLAEPGMEADDFVYLRGAQEDMLNKVMQMQLTLGPKPMMDHIAQRHPEMDVPLRAYGSSLVEATRVARENVLSITRWTADLRMKMRAKRGHEKFFSILRRAAFTENPGDESQNILLVNAGIDPRVPLLNQGDNFWLASKLFTQMTQPYRPFKSVVRGFDPEHQGVRITPIAVSLSDDKPLCAEMSPQGEVFNILAA